MHESLLDAVEIETGAQPGHTVLWLHGLGADGHDFEPLVPLLDLGGLPVRFIFPHAPVRAVSLNGGYRMRAWYDVHGLGRDSREDEAGVRAAAQQIEAFIRREAERGIAPDRLVLAGFSLGGALALFAGTRQEHPLAGVLALSTYLPLAKRLSEEVHAASRAVPIFMAHGEHDTVLTLSLAQESRAWLERAGCSVEWRTYPMGHELCAPQIDDIGAWLRRVLK